ncbi:hypothetical protein Tsubulata_043002 [Turnera subulata]|uniref:Uncharacterized protein n=1 Tax=Turnera subulata TaxID=218843 RepID=A0A9Q0GG08_9ROSI|nr:hypothetical protein Tsubulata_043002 [Turnera subulata]
MIRGVMLSLATILVILASISPSSNGYQIKKGVFYTPRFEMTPGISVVKYYYNSDFPKGHVALKSFRAELVDDEGQILPYSDVYLHHSIVFRYYQSRNLTIPDLIESEVLPKVDGFTQVESSGPCNGVHRHYLGLGTEMRGTPTVVPDPYGIEVGDPAAIPAGHDERWIVVVHAIDLRDTSSKILCAECTRDLYNVTLDQFGKPLKPDYEGGISCCYANCQCQVKEDANMVARGVRLRYFLEWADWDSSLFHPVRVHMLDVTDQMKKFKTPNGQIQTVHDCKIEYTVEACNEVNKENCVDVRKTITALPKGGHVVFAYAHIHEGGINSTLYGQDGRVICSASAIYGHGVEEGYVVASTTCVPEPGSVTIGDGEYMVHETVYAAERRRTGAMSILYLLIADDLPKPKSFLRSPLEMLRNSMV